MTQDLKEDKTTELKKEEVCPLTGSKSESFRDNLLGQIVPNLNSPNLNKENVKVIGESLIEAMRGIAPRNELEGMLVAQLISTHSAAMECFRRAANPNYSFEVQQKSLGCANKLVRSYAVLVESLERGRGKGSHEQKITVQHIHINDKAQAIVGDVARG